jgi:hypothetical protein
MRERHPAAQSPWYNRWENPTEAQLMAPYGEPIDTLLPKLFNLAAEQVPGLERQLLWHGTSWRWSFHYTAPTRDGGRDTLFYFVPNPLEHVIAIPMFPDMLQHVPVRRLNKYVRDGIRGAKWAVTTRWGMWTPSNNPEVDHLADLIKRKGKIMMGESPSQKRLAG